MKITVELNDDKLRNIIGNARIHYWADVIEWDRDNLYLIITDRDSGVIYTLTQSRFSDGAKAMSVYPGRFAELLTGRGDSITGDILVQMAAFGEIVYQ